MNFNTLLQSVSNVHNVSQCHVFLYLTLIACFDIAYKLGDQNVILPLFHNLARVSQES